MHSIKRLCPLLLSLALSLLTACSGGSGSSAPSAGQATTTATASPSLLEGIVASGAPLSGTIYVTDSSYPA